mgnify:CR=1
MSTYYILQIPEGFACVDGGCGLWAVIPHEAAQSPQRSRQPSTHVVQVSPSIRNQFD